MHVGLNRISTTIPSNQNDCCASWNVAGDNTVLLYPVFYIGDICIQCTANSVPTKCVSDSVWLRACYAPIHANGEHTYSHGLTTACGTYHYMMGNICLLCTTAHSNFWKQRNSKKREHTSTHAHDPNGREKNKDPFCCRPFLSYLQSKFARSALPEWRAQ